MNGRILVVSHYPLGDLRTHCHGVYQRLRVLLEAACALTSDVLLLNLGEGGEAGELTARAERARSQLLSEWQVDIDVRCTAGRRTYAGPWIAHQLLGAADYRLQEVPYRVGGAAACRELRSLAAAPTALVIAHKLIGMTLVRRCLPAQLPVVFDLDDIEHIAVKRTAPHMATWRDRTLASLGVGALLRAERLAARHARATLVCSAEDQATFGALCEGSRVDVLPNSVRQPRMITAVRATGVVLMVGMFTYEPNADGARYFIERIWPQIRAHCPTAEFRLAGKGSEVLATAAMARDGVKALGFVADLPALYDEAQIVVCPLLSGGGTRIKLLEAAAFGRPSVSTTVGQEGLGFRPGVHIAIGDSPEHFAAECVSLLEDVQSARRMADRAREHVITHLSQESVVRAFARLLQAVATESAVSPASATTQTV